MNEPRDDSKITVCCPSGHKIRGDAKFLGKTVKCPKCEATFIFAPVPVARLVSGITPAKADDRRVTDTGVMRILGDLGEMPEPPEGPPVEMRPCNRCGAAIPENLAVCNHCHCYVGVLPAYLQRMSGTRSAERN